MRERFLEIPRDPPPRSARKLARATWQACGPIFLAAPIKRPLRGLTRLILRRTVIGDSGVEGRRHLHRLRPELARTPRGRREWRRSGHARPGRCRTDGEPPGPRNGLVFIACIVHRCPPAFALSLSNRPTGGGNIGSCAAYFPLRPPGLSCGGLSGPIDCRVQGYWRDRWARQRRRRSQSAARIA